MNNGLGTAIIHAAVLEGDHWPLINKTLEGDHLAEYLRAPIRQRNIWRACLIAKNGHLPTTYWELSPSELLKICFPKHLDGFQALVERVELDVPTWTWAILSNILRTDERSTPFLLECGHISRGDVFNLAKLPKTCRFLLAQTMSLKGNTSRCAFDLDALVKAGADTDANVAELEVLAHPHSWYDTPSRRAFEQTRSTNFPAPPFLKTTHFTPITSETHLKEITEKYDNAAYSYLGAISENYVYIYEYHGEIDTLVLIRVEYENYHIQQMQSLFPTTKRYLTQVAIRMVGEAAAIGQDLGLGERRDKLTFTSCIGAEFG